MVQDYELDTTSLASHIRIFEEKIGKKVPLNFDISFKNPKVVFGNLDVDVILEYTTCFTVSSDG